MFELVLYALSLQLSISMKFYSDLQKYGADEVTLRQPCAQHNFTSLMCVNGSLYVHKHAI